MKRWLFCIPCLLFWLPASAQLDYSGALLLTELYYDTPGDDSREEWLEISNVGSVPLALDDVKVGDEEEAGGIEGMRRFPADAVIGAGESLIVAQTAVGFRQLFGFNPDFELVESDTAVPTMRRFSTWATGDIAFGNDGDELILMQGLTIIDAISYGDRTTFFAPPIAATFRGQSLSREPANCDSDSAADWQTLRQPTPGTITLDETCAQPINPALLEQLPSIGQIQGSDDVSPFVNEIVSFRGIVIGLHEDQNASGVVFYTLFVQDMPALADGDPATSDAIAVFLGRERPSMPMGAQVRVSGQVTEFFGLTEIDDDNLQMLVEPSDGPLPTPVSLDGQQPGEALEAMLVALPPVRVVGPTFAGCGFTVTLAATPRFFQRQDDAPPPAALIPILHHSDVACPEFPQVKTGDTVAGLTGPLTYHFDQFKIVPQATAVLTTTAVPLPAPPAPPALTPDQFSIATLNVENLFDGMDDTGLSAEPKLADDELQTKLQKLATAVSHVLGCPTLLGIQEVEKASLLTALADLTAADCGFTYTVTHLESPDGRGIDVALLSQPQRVAVQTAVLQQGCTPLNTGVADEGSSCSAGQQPLFSRPPLWVEMALDGQPLTLAVNHLKSKREGAAETAVWRQAQAAFLRDLVAAELATDANGRIVVLGDFNDFEASAPLQTLTADGLLTNALLTIPNAQRYSYVFGGVSQLIDGILLSPALADGLVSATIQHVNADYPAGLAHDTTAVALPFRSSDHDLPIVVLQLPDEPVMATAVPANVPKPTAVVPDAVGRGERPSFPWLWLLGGMGFCLSGVIWWWRKRLAVGD